MRFLPLLVFFAAACGDDGSSPVVLQGSVSGLAGTGLVLQNGGVELAITQNGEFFFEAAVPQGSTYDVTVKAQPSNPSQTCTVANGAGTVSGDEITPIAVTCATGAFTVGGTVSGLAGTGLVLQNSGGDDLAISDNGVFTFATPVASGAAFTVTVQQDPTAPSQTCTVMGGTGTVGGAPVTTVVVDCATDRFVVGGEITGLEGSVVLQNNAGDDITVTSNGTFAFPTTVASGAAYDVTVLTQPDAPISQTCTVTAGTGSGTVADADVTSVRVVCVTNTFTVGGTVTGLAGTGLVLRNNGGDDLAITMNGAFTFATPVASGATYAVTVATNPAAPTQTCVVTNGAGTVTNAAVTDVVVTCTTNRYTVGGTINGLAGTVVLRNNGGNDLTRTANGAFTFTTTVASGQPYAVTVFTQPSGQTCSVSAGSGTVTNAAITNVVVTCVAATTGFPVVVPNTSYGLGDIAFAANGDLLVTATGSTTGHLVRVTRAGVQSVVATGFGGRYLLGVAYRAANDTIYVLNDVGQIYTVVNGTPTLFTTVTGSNAITIAPAGFGVYGGYVISAGQDGRIVAVEPTTGTTTVIATTSQTSDLAFGPDGTLYVSGTTTVRTVTAAGVVTTFATGFSAADGVTVAADNSRLFVADSTTDTVRQIALPGLGNTSLGSYDIDDGFFVGGIIAAPDNTVFVLTGESSLTIRAFTF